nr:alpha/beta hydrolase [uncultured Trichococcus sp.]
MKTNSCKVSGTYSAYLQGNDWGENISRITLELDKPLDVKTLSADDFTVSETREIFDWQQADKGVFETTNPRTILSAYPSDEEGKQTNKASKFVTLELSTGPNDGRYYLLSPDSPSSQYPKVYKLNVALSEKSDVTSNGGKVTDLIVDAEMTKLTHSAPEFTTDTFTSSDGVKYQYAQYSPETSSDTLVVWLHGLLEGGSQNTDPYITVLGNEAANLAREEFQKTIGGVHILAPQSPSFWMDKTGKDQLINGRIDSDGTSFYTKSLQELIQQYKEKVGAKKVVIAGCSNGGFMGMILAREYGKEYDAYMLLCEAMENRFVTGEDIQKLKDLPLYFVYSTKDPLVIPEDNEIPTIQRLKDAGANNLQVAVFDDVLDTSGTLKGDDGKPYDFGGHSVWVPFFNNEVKISEDISAWEWIAQQVK